MFEAVGKRVVYLKRISMGPLELDESLELGEYRELTEEELSQLKNYHKKEINRLIIIGDLFLVSIIFKKIVLLSFWSLSIFHDSGLLTKSLYAKTFKSRCIVRGVIPNSSTSSCVVTVPL